MAGDQVSHQVADEGASPVSRKEGLQVSLAEGRTSSDEEDDVPAVPLQGVRRFSFGSQTVRGFRDITRKQKEELRNAASLPKEGLEVSVMRSPSTSDDEEERDRADAGSSPSTSDTEAIDSSQQAPPPRRLSFGAQTFRGLQDVTRKQKEEFRNAASAPKEGLEVTLLGSPSTSGDEASAPSEEKPQEEQAEIVGRRLSFGSQTLRGLADVTRKQKEEFRRRSAGPMVLQQDIAALLGDSKSAVGSAPLAQLRRRSSDKLKEELLAGLLISSHGSDSSDSSSSSSSGSSRNRRVCGSNGRTATPNIEGALQVSLLEGPTSSDDEPPVTSQAPARKLSFGSQTVRGLQDITRKQTQEFRTAAVTRKEGLEVEVVAISGSSSDDTQAPCQRLDADVKQIQVPARRVSLGSETLRGLPDTCKKRMDGHPRSEPVRSAMKKMNSKTVGTGALGHPETKKKAVSFDAEACKPKPEVVKVVSDLQVEVMLASAEDGEDSSDSSDVAARVIPSSRMSSGSRTVHVGKGKARMSAPARVCNTFAKKDSEATGDAQGTPMDVQVDPSPDPEDDGYTFQPLPRRKCQSAGAKSFKGKLSGGKLSGVRAPSAISASAKLDQRAGVVAEDAQPNGSAVLHSEEDTRPEALNVGLLMGTVASSSSDDESKEP